MEKHKKILFVSDFHGANLKYLEDIVEKENPDVMISLGDYDLVSTIKDYLRIKDKLEEKGKLIFSMPGNHDLAILYKQPITSGTLRRLGKDIYQLHDELKKDPEAYNFINSLRYIASTFKLNDNNVVAIHGGLSGYDYCPDCDEKGKRLWYRVIDEESHSENFKMMKQEGFNIMVRGHDHYPQFAYSENEKVKIVPIEYYFRVKKDKGVNINLDSEYLKNILITITVGAYYKDNYLTMEDIDNKKIRFSFKKFNP